MLSGLFLYIYVYMYVCFCVHIFWNWFEIEIPNKVWINPILFSWVFCCCCFTSKFIKYFLPFQKDWGKKETEGCNFYKFYFYFCCFCCYFCSCLLHGFRTGNGKFHSYFNWKCFYYIVFFLLNFLFYFEIMRSSFSKYIANMPNMFYNYINEI